MNVLKWNENVMTFWKKLRYQMYEINLLNEMRNLCIGIYGIGCGHQTCYVFIKICVLVKISINHIKNKLYVISLHGLCICVLIRSYTEYLPWIWVVIALIVTRMLWDLRYKSVLTLDLSTRYCKPKRGCEDYGAKGYQL